MVKYLKAQLFKNNNEIMQLKYDSINIKNKIKMMSLTITHHGPRATSLVW